MGPPTCSLTVDTEVIFNRAVLRLMLFFPPLWILLGGWNITSPILPCCIELCKCCLLSCCFCVSVDVPSFSYGVLAVPALKNNLYGTLFLPLLRVLLSFWSVSSPVLFALPGTCFVKFLPEEQS